jgi:hypothetical protein
MDPVEDKNLTDDNAQASASTEESASNVTLEDVNIDDWLGMPGADSIVTAESDKEEEEDEKKTIFSSEKPSDMSFLEEDSSSEEEVTETDEAIAQLDDEIDNLQNATSDKDKKKVSGQMVRTFSKMIEEGTLMGFDDDKPLSEYEEQDWKELLQANFEQREEDFRQRAPREFFDALPPELQYAAEYVAKGGTDMKGLFKVLAQAEEKRSLDPGRKEDQESIVREYLYATNFGEGDKELLEDQVKEWQETGMLSKKAKQFKPKLDQMEQKMLANKLAQQEQFRQQQVAQKQAYMDNIYQTLKPGELNGVKLNGDKQKFLWDELTTIKYESMSGQQTNLLGKLLEEYQFGKEQRYDLIAEALWLLSDPQDYKDSIGRTYANDANGQALNTLKTEQSRRLQSSSDERSERDDQRRTIRKQPRNIFGKG